MASADMTALLGTGEPASLLPGGPVQALTTRSGIGPCVALGQPAGQLEAKTLSCWHCLMDLLENVSKHILNHGKQSASNDM